MTNRMTDAEYEAACHQKFSNTEEMVDELANRFGHRQCMICGADSGKELLLPPGWSYMIGGDATPCPAEVVGFLCERCAKRMGFPENRNYCQDVN